jgi:UDP-3-O-[3-hydroxymyristoyl] glucosamine N-acyltransferase
MMFGSVMTARSGRTPYSASGRCSAIASCCIRAWSWGTEGFGYRPSPDGRRILHIPHIGHVEIGDDVEIGANSAVDRGKFGPTRIGAQTKIDNLVQIGHNCRIGRGCMISGLAGIAGSVTLEDGVIIGGGAGLRDHITIGAGAKIAARAAVMDSIPAGETWSGYPAQPHHDTLRREIAIRKMLKSKSTARRG